MKENSQDKLDRFFRERFEESEKQIPLESWNELQTRLTAKGLKTRTSRWSISQRSQLLIAAFILLTFNLAGWMWYHKYQLQNENPRLESANPHQKQFGVALPNPSNKLKDLIRKRDNGQIHTTVEDYQLTFDKSASADPSLSMNMLVEQSRKHNFKQNYPNKTQTFGSGNARYSLAANSDKIKSPGATKHSLVAQRHSQGNITNTLSEPSVEYNQPLKKSFSEASTEYLPNASDTLTQYVAMGENAASVIANADYTIGDLPASNESHRAYPVNESMVKSNTQHTINGLPGSMQQEKETVKQTLPISPILDDTIGVAIIDSADTVVKKKSSDAISDLDSAKKLTDDKHRYGRFSIGLFVLPSVSAVSHVSVGSDKVPVIEKGFRNVMDGSVTLNLHLSRHWSLSTGLMLSTFQDRSTISERKTYTDTTAVMTFNSNTVGQNSAGSNNSNYAQQTAFQQSHPDKAEKLRNNPNLQILQYEIRDSLVTQTSKRTNVYQYLGIPIQAGYSFGNQKFAVKVSSGIVLNIPVSGRSVVYNTYQKYPSTSLSYVSGAAVPVEPNTLTYSYTKFSDDPSQMDLQSVAPTYEKVHLKNVHVMYLAGVECQWSLTTKIGISTGLLFRKALHSVVTSKEIKTLPYSAGLQFGLTYAL